MSREELEPVEEICRGQLS